MCGFQSLGTLNKDCDIKTSEILSFSSFKTIQWQ